MNTNPVESARKIVLKLNELVRGQEQSFLEELAPAVVREDVTLDFAAVERIDAAGLAALITLYTDACKAGHRLTVLRPSRHVSEILKSSVSTAFSSCSPSLSSVSGTCNCKAPLPEWARLRVKESIELTSASHRNREVVIMHTKLLCPIAFSFIAVLSCTSSHAQDAVSAKAFLVNIYSHYSRGGKGVDFDGPRSALYFHSSLLALEKADVKANGPDSVPAMDADPICGCQDWEGIWNLAINVR